MPFALLDNLGQMGWLPDIPPGDQPLNGWTNVRNVKFTGIHMENVSGMGTFANLSAVVTNLRGIGGLRQGGAQYWYAVGYFGGVVRLIRFTDAGAVTDISPESPAAVVTLTDGMQMTGGAFDDTFILATGATGPAFAVTSSAVSELLYGTGTALSSKLKFNVVRPWRQHLWGLGPVVTGTVDEVPAGTYPRLLWCSDAADPGYLPGNWEASNPASLSRNYISPFVNYSGPLVDMVPLGVNAVVYQEDACHLMRYTGEFPALVSIGTIFTEFGLMAPNCAIQLAGNHVVFSPSDIVSHNGQTAESILKNRTRRWLFNNLSDTYYKNSFIAPNLAEKELYICFPMLGEEFPSQALVWNYEHNTFSVRDFVEPVVGSAVGFQDSRGLSSIYAPSVPSLVLGGKDGEVFRMGTGPGSFHVEATISSYNILAANETGDWLAVNAGGDELALNRAYNSIETPFECLAEREGFEFISEEIPYHTRTLLREVWPEMDGEFFTDLVEAVPLAVNEGGDFLAVNLSGDFLAISPEELVSKKGTVNVYVGGSELLASEMRWQGPFPFTIGEDDFIPLLVEGRRHGIRVTWNNGANIRIRRIGFEFEYIGKW